MKIELRNILKQFKQPKNNELVNAVNKLNLTIEDGSLVALLGPSGCGKSTTLNLISGLEDVTEGQIFFGDKDVTNLESQYRNIGMVFQNYALYPHLTVLQNVSFPLLNIKKKLKLSKDEIDKRVMHACKLVQIENFLDRLPKQLSGGQQQRVAIARALVKNPDVLLLDEPLSNLDARLRIETRQEIRNIQQSTKVTTIFVTHDQEEAMSIADSIVVLKDGNLMQQGKPQEVYDDPHNLFVAKFLGTPTINEFDAEIIDGNIYINNCKIKATKYKNQKVKVAIRPEGFIYNPNGVLTLDFKKDELLGKDRAIICTCNLKDIRCLIPSEIHIDIKNNKISFDIKDFKMFMFDLGGNRLYE